MNKNSKVRILTDESKVKLLNKLNMSNYEK